MPVTHSGFLHHAQLAAAIDRTIQKLGPEVVRVSYSVGEDTGGDPAVYFRIALTDNDSGGDTLADVTGRITRTIFDELLPIENWGMYPHFRFRSESEHAVHNDPAWT